MKAWARLLLKERTCGKYVRVADAFAALRLQPAFSRESNSNIRKALRSYTYHEQQKFGRGQFPGEWESLVEDWKIQRLPIPTYPWPRVRFSLFVSTNIFFAIEHLKFSCPLCGADKYSDDYQPGLIGRRTWDLITHERGVLMCNACSEFRKTLQSTRANAQERIKRLRLEKTEVEVTVLSKSINDLRRKINGSRHKRFG